MLGKVLLVVAETSPPFLAFVNPLLTNGFLFSYHLHWYWLHFHHHNHCHGTSCVVPDPKDKARSCSCLRGWQMKAESKAIISGLKI